jgi:putative acetyltransferase
VSVGLEWGDAPGAEKVASGSGWKDRTVIGEDDPRDDDVRALLERHLAFTAGESPPEDVHALGVDALVDPALVFVSFRDERDRVLGVGAIKDLGGGHAELTSMHTALEARRRGVGRSILTHLLGVARERGWRRVSLETGSLEAFAPARRMYAAAGFEPCEPFGDYSPSVHSAFMTLEL